ncbi:hypothetical protein [Peribacillus asahii]|uniref:Uncharacterized protein n=1 Tax=Peribacillus asahii TaxID=228899 RepID=A0A3T0KRU1_9BACI|nr:hypothetical protein [Peribacillus asahii]AZV43020.1 hypothetical protein BAOM_2411 [Peribacillus asahii]USK83149.1 hypothetical protein LIT35_11565 [Peribacillus asahii]
MNFHFNWSIEWIQDYESPWGILEKFSYANVIDGNTILELIGNENVKQLKSISNAGSSHRNLIYFFSIDSELSQKIIGIDLKEYHAKLVDKLIHKIPNIKYESKYFHSNLSYCPICLSKGYHSILHQLIIFDHCAFHPEQKLIERCVRCNKLMPEYLINKGFKEAFRCSCGHHFLDSENIRSIFLSWKNQPKIQNTIINSWLNLPREKVYQYHLIYPFDNYKKYFVINNTDYLTMIPQLMIHAFYDKSPKSKEIIKISSNKGILKIKNDYRLLKENYLKAYSRQFSDFRFNEKHKIDSFFFEIYKQTRIIYKAISRFILRNIIRDHKKCVEIFNKARQNGDVCPHALAFIWWKMECEGIDSPWEIEIHTKVHETYDFEWIKERFSIFLHGTFMTHLEEVLNPISREEEFDFFNCNVSSINYILNKIVSHLLIERYIKWLEVIQNPKKFKRLHPDDTIPMYLAKIPRNSKKEIVFYFPSGRIKYMKNLIKDISDQVNCPINKNKMYPSFKSPIQIVMDKIDKRR